METDSSTSYLPVERFFNEIEKRKSLRVNHSCRSELNDEPRIEKHEWDDRC